MCVQTSVRSGSQNLGGNLEVCLLQDDLAIEGLRCRPFFRPGQKEDLYSWARAALVRMREATGDGSSPEWASSFLDDVCLTHYFTLSDVYDDAKVYSKAVWMLWQVREHVHDTVAQGPRADDR